MTKVVVYWAAGDEGLGIYGHVVGTDVTYFIDFHDPDTSRPGNRFVQLGDGFVFTVDDVWTGTNWNYGSYLAYSEGKPYDVASNIIYNDAGSNLIEQPGSYVSFAGEVVFLAETDSGTGYSPPRDLMITNGTGAPELLFPHAVDQFWRIDGKLFVLGYDGDIYRILDDRTHTKIHDNIAPPSQIAYIFHFDGKLHARAKDANWDNDFFAFDPVTGVAQELNVAEDAGGENVRFWFQAAGDSQFFFWNNDLGLGYEPYVSDGTPAGTQFLKDINPGSGHSIVTTSNGGAIHTTVGDLYFFVAYDGSTDGNELWVSDGTAAGTFALSGTGTSVGALSFYYPSWIELGNELLFTADGGSGYELYATDGTVAGTRLVKDIYTGGSSDPDLYFVDDGLAYFTTYDGTDNGGVWVTDGTTEGTVNVSDPATGTAAYPGRYLSLVDIDTSFLAPEGLLVITHGWSSTTEDPPASYMDTLSLAAKARLEAEGKTVQIVTDLSTADLTMDVIIYEYVWEEAFTQDGASFESIAGYVLSYHQTDEVGASLADEIDAYISYVSDASGTEYDPDVHLVGHSLGTMVNAYAVEALNASPDGINEVEQVTILDDPLAVGVDPFWTKPLTAPIPEVLPPDPFFYNDHMPDGSVDYVDNFYAANFINFGGPIFGSGPTPGGWEAGTDHTGIWDTFYINVVANGNWVTPLIDPWSPLESWTGGAHPDLGTTDEGTTGNDTVNGTDDSDFLKGLEGDDLIRGFQGGDFLFGGPGLDTIRGNEGDDEIDGGPDDDTIRGHSGFDILFGGDGDDDVFGGSEDDILLGGNNVDFLQGGGGIDTGYGGDGDDTLRTEIAWGEDGNDMIRIAVEGHGGDGDDDLRATPNGAAQLFGDADNDILLGGLKNDLLNGGPGDDFLRGDEGKDVHTGGLGADTFRFNEGDIHSNTVNTDRITDYDESEGDRINLVSIDAIAGGADDAFTFIGNAAFSNTAGELRWEQDATDTYLMGDTTGDGIEDFMIRLDGLVAISAAGLVL